MPAITKSFSVKPSKKPSAEELLKSLTAYQTRASALSLLIKELAPASGFYFVTSARGHIAFLYHVDDDFNVNVYAEDRTATELAERDRALCTLFAESPHYASLLDCLKTARIFRAANIPNAAAE